MKKYNFIQKSIFLLFLFATSFVYSATKEAEYEALLLQKLSDFTTAQNHFVCAQRNLDAGSNEECRKHFVDGVKHLQHVGLGVFGSLINYCYAAMDDEQGTTYLINWFPSQIKKQNDDTITINLSNQEIESVHFLSLLKALFPSYEEKKSFTCQIIKDFVTNVDAVEDHVQLIDFLTNDPKKVQDEPFWSRPQKNEHLYLPAFSEELLAIIFNWIDTNEIYKRNAAGITLRDFESSTFVFAKTQKEVIIARVQKYAEKLAQNGPTYMKIFYADHFVEKTGQNSFPKMTMCFYSATTAEVADFHMYCGCGMAEADLEKAIASGHHIEFGEAFYPSLFGKIDYPAPDSDSEVHEIFSKQMAENSKIYQKRLRIGYKKILHVLESSNKDGHFDDLITCLKRDLEEIKVKNDHGSYLSIYLACKNDIMSDFTALFTKISNDSEQEITESDKANLINWFEEHKVIFYEMKFGDPDDDRMDEVEEVGSYNYYFAEAIRQIISENDPNALQYYYALTYSGFSSGGIFDFGEPFQQPVMLNFSTNAYNLNVRKHKKALELYFESINIPSPYTIIPTEGDIREFLCLQPNHIEILETKQGDFAASLMSGNYSGTPTKAEYGEGAFFSGQAYNIEKEEVSINGHICTQEFVHIKAKKFIFKKNGFINARKGSLIEAEEFVLEGGQVAYPNLCHLIQVPKGSLTLSAQSGW